MLSTSVANSVRVASSRVTSSRSFWCVSACSCAAVASAAAMAARAVSSACATTSAASASLSRLVWSTNFCARSSVRCSVSSVSAASAGGGRRGRLALGRHRGGPLVALELGDPLARLTQPLVQLPDVLLEPLGLLGRLVQVLIDLIDVVPLQTEAELDRAQGVEDRCGSLGIVHGGRV